MKQLTKSKSIKFSETQFNSLEILESYGVNYRSNLTQI